MIQFSVYARACVSFARQDTHIERVKKQPAPGRKRARDIHYPRPMGAIIHHLRLPCLRAIPEEMPEQMQILVMPCATGSHGASYTQRVCPRLNWNQGKAPLHKTFTASAVCPRLNWNQGKATITPAGTGGEVCPRLNWNQGKARSPGGRIDNEVCPRLNWNQGKAARDAHAIHAPVCPRLNWNQGKAEWG